MTYFKEPLKILGEVKANSKKTVIFEGVANLPDISRITSSCSCTTPKKVGNNIKVVFMPGGFPKHLIGKDSYETMKQFIVYYKNGTKEVLSFKAEITKK